MFTVLPCHHFYLSLRYRHLCSDFLFALMKSKDVLLIPILSGTNLPLFSVHFPEAWDLWDIEGEQAEAGIT